MCASLDDSGFADTRLADEGRIPSCAGEDLHHPRFIFPADDRVKLMSPVGQITPELIERVFCFFLCFVAQVLGADSKFFLVSTKRTPKVLSTLKANHLSLRS
jgi:hypothetical protein